MVVLGMHNTIPCFCCSLMLPILYIWLNMISMSSFIVLQYFLKNSTPMPSCPGALFSVPLCTIVCNSFAVIDMPIISAHLSATIRCPACTICYTHSSSTYMGPYFRFICPTNVSNMPHVVVCRFPFSSRISMIIRVSHRFRPCIRWNNDGFSPEYIVGSLASTVIVCSGLLCSLMILAFNLCNLADFFLG